MIQKYSIEILDQHKNTIDSTTLNAKSLKKVKEIAESFKLECNGESYKITKVPYVHAVLIKQNEHIELYEENNRHYVVDKVDLEEYYQNV